jgi:DNA topoisomerase IA
MRIALICEKPSMAKSVIEELLFIETEMDRSAFVVGWANEFYHLNSAFVFPRGQAYQTFPMTREAEYKPLTFDGRYLDSEFRMEARKGIPPNTHPFGSRDHIIDNEDFVSSLKRADIVYIAFDSGPSSFHVQMRVLDWLQSLNAHFVVKHLPFTSLTSRDLHFGLVNAHEITNLSERAHLSLVRRHFDYNYLLNAYPIMGMTSEKACGQRLAWPLSKHELQVLYFMRDRKGLNDGQLCQVMQNWKGTGRYNTKGWDWYYGIGNPASRTTIMENLLKQGLLERVDKRKLVISPKGERLLQFLHPDCEDPDQVMRIHSWAELPIDVAKSKIDRYIKTFFGKQKRFLSKVHASSVIEDTDMEMVDD